MKIIFYSTNSNEFNPQTFKISATPSNETFFENFVKRHPEHKFICVSQAPSMFMPEKSTVSANQSLNALEFADKLLELNPDVAVPLSFWTAPFDWLSINDCLVAEKLEQNGVKTFCHPLETNLICFDKRRTYQKLIAEGFCVPKSVFIDHDLYFCAGNQKEVLRNVYKDSVKSQIAKLKFPLVIKDAFGLSSYGTTVVHNYGDAICYLDSKRNNSNRIAQEYIEGEQFGVELYGIPGDYEIFPPFSFSLNRYGITSPKQSAKFGPRKLDKTLKKTILKLANSLNFCGAAQIDLIYSQNKWHIIEINPRLSGMTLSYCALFEKSVFDFIFDLCVSKYLKKSEENFREKKIRDNAAEKNALRSCANSKSVLQKKILSVKLPILSEKTTQNLLKNKNIAIFNQTNNEEAKQEREKGFCECIIAGKTNGEIKNVLKKLEPLFPCEQDSALFAQSYQLIQN